MQKARKLSTREQVFLSSLQWFNFEITTRRSHLKLRRGYVIPATAREDSSGIDMWVKIPHRRYVYPVQVTQRGIRIFRLLSRPTEVALADFIQKSNERIAKKEAMCLSSGIVFVLLRDYIGAETNFAIARRDYKALMYALNQAKHLL